MTTPRYQFKAPQQQETPIQVVTIGNVDVFHKIAACTTLNGGGNLLINLSVFSGPVLVWPNPGEQWYVHLVKGQWILGQRSYVSAQAYLTEAQPGDQVWNIQGNLTIDVSGKTSFTDSTGVLTPSPVPVWTPVSYQNGWTDYGSGYPPVEFVVDGNTVRFRGVMGPGTTADSTEVFSIPAMYSIPFSQQLFPIASVFGQPTAVGSGLKIATNAGGAFLIFSVGTCTAISVDAISYFYKY